MNAKNKHHRTHQMVGWCVVLVLIMVGRPAAQGSTTLLYSHGDPTDAEQLLLELVNRARANPGEEAARWGIGLNQGLPAGAISDAPKQPLAFHSRLISAARDHSGWMLETGKFSHTGKGNSEPWHRMRKAGYRLTGSYTAGENIAGYDTLVPDAWQVITERHHEGLFHSPGHRRNMLRAAYDDVGLGIIDGWTDDGLDEARYKSLATQKFARSDFTRLPFAVGVVYCDLNNNSAYDMGEGLRGVRVTVQGGRHHTETSTSGGFAVPVPDGGGQRTVHFTQGTITHSQPARFRARRNEKVDWRLPYEAPVVSGPVQNTAGVGTRFSVAPVVAATSVEVLIQRLLPPGSTDSAEDLSRVTYETAGGYAPLSSVLKHEGVHSYHLRPGPPYEPQILHYRDYLLPGPGATLSFEGLLRANTATLTAEVEVSDDDGRTWTPLHLQRQMTEASVDYFLPDLIRLDGYEGKKVLLRFRLVEYSENSPRWTVSNAGWFIDTITFHNTKVLATESVLPVGPDGAIVFTPRQRGEYHLTARPLYHGRPWPPGTALVPVVE